MTILMTPDMVVFREPIHVGELVTFDASVNSCYFTMVAIGPDG
jgi:acyl-CoA hydrolase